MAMPKWFVRSILVLAAVLALPLAVPATAQSRDPAKSRETVETVRNFNASMGLNEPRSFAADARFAYDEGVWDLALAWSRRACDGNDGLGCNILGRVLAEGKAGPADPRGAEAAHRKAAGLYDTNCRADGVRTAETCADAGDFMAHFAVPAVRNQATARAYYTRALDQRAQLCLRGYRSNCFEAGFIAAGAFTGRADPKQALVYWRKDCDDPKSDSDAAASCNKIVETLVFGPEDVRDAAEARRRILADQCSIASPASTGARRGDRLYCAILAEQLIDGQGGPADIDKGEKLLRMSCARGQDSACASLRNRGIDLDDMKTAAALLDLGFATDARDAYETQCTANNARACNEAGRLFSSQGNDADKGKSAQFYARSCTLGSAAGCYNSGDALRRQGGASNLTAARAALRKGCDANDAPSCRLVAFMIERGEGGPADLAEANRLYDIACNGNDGAACNNLGNAYLNGSALAANPARARTLHEKACGLGRMDGCNSFGFALMNGRGGPQDEAAARIYFQRACDGNNSFACGNLGRLLRDGRGGASDHAASRRYYEKGCDLRNAAACIGYSDALLTSLGGPTDRAKAISIRRIACLALDNADACQWLVDGGHSDPAQEGAILANSGKVDRALPLFRRACDAGQASGCLGLASFTPRGDATVEAE